MSKEANTEQQYREKVQAQAKTIKTPEALTQFIQSLLDHKHDYGTIVVACGAAMQAALHVMCNGPMGSITGFQASCVMWEIIPSLSMIDASAGAKILSYADLLYPQYDGKFETRISTECAAMLTEMAKKRIGDHPDDMPGSNAVSARWQEVAAGKFPPFVKIGKED